MKRLTAYNDLLGRGYATQAGSLWSRTTDAMSMADIYEIYIDEFNKAVGNPGGGTGGGALNPQRAAYYNDLYNRGGAWWIQGAGEYLAGTTDAMTNAQCVLWSRRSWDDTGRG
jgi:hypothetical protein